MKQSIFCLPALLFTLSVSCPLMSAAAPGGGIKPLHQGAKATGAHRADSARRGERGEHDGRRGPRHPMGDTLVRLDTDGSGDVTLDEFLARPLERAPHQFDRLDADDDGLVTLDEFTARRGDGHADLRVEVDEIRACIAEAVGTEIPDRPAPEELFESMDTDADGLVDADEFVTSANHSATVRFSALDADADSVISADEFAAALEIRREHRQARRECLDAARDLEDLFE